MAGYEVAKVSVKAIPVGAREFGCLVIGWLVAAFRRVARRMRGCHAASECILQNDIRERLIQICRKNVSNGVAKGDERSSLIWIPGEAGTVSDPLASVLHAPQATILVDHEALGIKIDGTVVQRATFLHLSDEVHSPHPPGIKIVVPFP